MPLETKVAAARAEIEKINRSLASAKTNDIEKARTTRPYWDKKRDLDELISFSRILQMKLASEQIDVSIPRSTMVEIMDRAVSQPNEVADAARTLPSTMVTTPTSAP